MGAMELDFSPNASRVTWRGEGGAEDVAAHVCVQIKRLSHPCDCLGNVDKDDFVMHTYDPVDNPDFRTKQKFTNMMYVSNLKQGSTVLNVPTYVMPHWHTNYENQMHELSPPEEKLKVFFAGEQKYLGLSKTIKRNNPELLENGQFVYETYPQKSVSNSWELQRILHDNANQADIIVVSRYSKKGFFQPVIFKPALRMYNAWSHRQAAIMSNEWSYYEYSNFWFGQMPSIIWNTNTFAEKLSLILNNRTYLEKVATMGYSVVPLFGDSLIHHYPLSVCHNWKKTRKEAGKEGDRMSSPCEYLDELLEYSNPVTPTAWTHDVFAPGGPIFGDVDLKSDGLVKILAEREERIKNNLND